MAVTITVYGGAGEIGGNKILLEDAGTRIFLDFGVSFGTRGLYYEEFLNPRAPLGILDPLVMGLLPPLFGIYRDDLVVSRDIWDRVRKHPHYREIPEIHGVLLSHAHIDHSGYISFLSQTVPIYATRMTAFIAKAMQDVGKSDLERDVTYTSPRVVGEDGVLSSDRKRYAQRPFALIDGPPERKEALIFWGTSPTKTKAIEPSAFVRSDQVGNLRMRFFYVDHSIMGACAFAIETSAGWVIYTGDLRLHGSQGNLTEAFVQQAAALRPTVLFCEGTNVRRDTQTSEDEVHKNALNLVREATGLVIADFGPRNTERLLTFYRVAKETGRTLVILSKDQYMLDAIRLASGGPWNLEDMADVLIYDDRKGMISTVEARIRELYAARLLSPEQVHKNPAAFMLCLSFFDVKNLIDIDPPHGGLYIYSSSEAYEEEQEIDQRRLRNWLDRFGFQHVGFEGTEGLHASGHASGPDLVRIVREIAPRVLIPIHTVIPDFFIGQLAGAGIDVLVPHVGVAVVL